MKCICSQTNSLRLQGKPNRQFRIQVQKYLSSPSCAVSEFPLQMFSTWFQDLGLSKLMSHNEREDGDEIWEYKFVLLYPTNVQTNKAEVTWCKLATEAARQFYSTSFNSTEADLRSIHHAVQSDPTIMVIGRPVGKGEGHAQKSIIGCADSVVFHALHLEMELEMKVVRRSCFGS
jgi:hypothetical protein